MRFNPGTLGYEPDIKNSTMEKNKINNKTKVNSISIIAFILILIPGILFLMAWLKTYLNIGPSNALGFLLTWSMSARIILYNTIFFVIPVLALVLSITNIKKARTLNSITIVLSALILLWYVIQLIFD